MAYQCTVYDGHPDQGARVIKVYTEEMLAARADAALTLQTTNSGYTSTFLPREMECLECGRTFWRTVRGKKYCSNKEPPHCSQKAFKRNAKIRAKGYRAKRKQEGKL